MNKIIVNNNTHFNHHQKAYFQTFLINPKAILNDILINTKTIKANTIKTNNAINTHDKIVRLESSTQMFIGIILLAKRKISWSLNNIIFIVLLIIIYLMEIKSGLSNNISLESGIIKKRYSENCFKKHYGNNELKVLDIIGRDFQYKANVLEYKFIQGINSNKINKNYLFNFSKEIKRFWEHNHTGMKNNGFLNAAKFLKIENEQVSIDGLKLLNKEPVVILHNDLVCGNIIKNKNHYSLIDFEYSGYGYFLFDIASFLTERKLSRKNEEFFLKQFDNIDQDDLLIIKKFLQLFWSRWAIFQYENTNDKTYKKIANWKQKQLEKLS